MKATYHLPWIASILVILLGSPSAYAQSPSLDLFLEELAEELTADAEAESAKQPVPTAAEVRRLFIDIENAKAMTLANMQRRAYAAATGQPTDLDDVRGDTMREVRAERQLERLIAKHRSDLVPALKQLADDPEPLIARRASSILSNEPALSSPPIARSAKPSSKSAQPPVEKPLAAAASPASTESVSKKTIPRPATWTNRSGMLMVKLKSDRFEMGSTSQEDFQKLIDQAKSTEEEMEVLGIIPPKRTIAIESDFSMSAHEVTVAQFRQFVEATGYQTDAERDGQGGTGMLADGSFAQIPKFNWRFHGMDQTDDTPVVNVSWNDCQAYCKWLTNKENRTYRLPSEAEWEYACRAGSEQHYSPGAAPTSLEGHANVADQSLASRVPGLPWAASFDDGYPFLAPVGKFKPNAFGLFDMHGNALEWCQDRFSFLQPLGVEPGSGPAMHVLRGGNWFNDPLRAGSPSRSGANPDHRMSLIGFRVVAEKK